MGFMTEEEREALRQEVARHTQEFLSKGGRVIEVNHGLSGIGGNGLLSFKINNVENPQPRTNNGLFSESTKRKARTRKLDKVVTEVGGNSRIFDEDAVVDTGDGGMGDGMGDGAGGGL